MSRRASLLATLPKGPRAPTTVTPAPRRGSVRRTTSIERGWAEPLVVEAVGRDLLTPRSGPASTVDEVTLRIEIGMDDVVRTIASLPEEPGLAAVVGAPSRSGFRAAVDGAAPALAERAAVLHQLLDDVPLAGLIASYGWTRENDGWDIPPAAADRLTDLCAGWAGGGTMVGALTSTGTFPIPEGPPAPPVDGVEPLGPGLVRRLRRVDVWPASAGLLAVEAWFRDSHRGVAGAEDVLHEYTLTAIVDRAEMEVRSAEAVAHVLPWPECPGALASADRVVGMHLADIRARVNDELTGTSTCTHLNDVLRSLAGVPALAAALR